MAAEIETSENTPEERPLARSTRSGEKAAKRPRSVVKPIRSIAIFGAVGALVTAIALPAFAATNGGGQQSAAPATMQQIAADNSQSLVVASEATTAPVARDSFTATTPEEIEKKKAEEAAAARAAALAATAAAAAANSNNSSGGSSGSLSNVDLTMTAPGSGEVRYPLANFTSGEGPGSGRGHQGWDMIAPQGTPIFAAAAGVVTVSQESYGGYGVAVEIEHVVGGQSVMTRYGHMVYGSRVVEAGQTVAAGQLIGQVGNTGNSFGAHLHFEVHIGGGIVDPESWLAANAG